MNSNKYWTLTASYSFKMKLRITVACVGNHGAKAKNNAHTFVYSVNRLAWKWEGSLMSGNSVTIRKLVKNVIFFSFNFFVRWSVSSCRYHSATIHKVKNHCTTLKETFNYTKLHFGAYRSKVNKCLNKKRALKLNGTKKKQKQI